MTLGEIKVETLKLLFANGENEIQPIDNVGNGSAMTLGDAALDNQFRDYLLKIPGAINRCYAELEAEKVVPAKRLVLLSFAEENAANMEIDLDEVSGLTDYDDIQRLTVRNGMEYDAYAQYELEGKVLILPFVRKGDTVTMIYYHALARITSTTGADTVIGLPDKIAALIPYYCKFDIYREDNATEADKAYQVFRAGIELVKQNGSYGYQSSVDRTTWGV